MNLLLSPFFLSFIASCSTLVGYLLTFLGSDHPKKVIGAVLSFSAGVMISISLFDLIPEGFSYFRMFQGKWFFLLLFFLIGFFLSFFLSRFFSSTPSLYRIGILSMIGLMIHNIPEGIITYLTSSSNIRLGFSLSLAIACHNIPEGFSIAIPIFYATGSRRRSFFYTSLAGFAELFGAIFASLFLTNLSPLFFSYVLIFTAGIMLSISFLELVPEALNSLPFFSFFFYFLIGFLFIIFIL